MKRRQKSQFSMLVSVQQFIWRNRDALGVVIWSDAFGAICEVVKEVTAFVTAQWIAQALGRRLTQVKAALRDDLRVRYMKPIAAIARTALWGNPIIARLKVPQGRRGDAKVIAAASSMAAAAARYRNVFRFRGQLPPDFIPQLRRAATAIQRVLLERSQSQTERVAATQGIEDQLRRASHRLPILDGMVVEQLAGCPSLLAEWKIARRVVPLAEVSAPVKPRLDAA